MVEVPPFAESITEGDIRWIKEVGDRVSEDEPLAEVETDKVGGCETMYVIVVEVLFVFH